jgi:uncharacterized DUF497 family protein
MQIRDIIWLPDVVDKLDRKHGVFPDEVQDLFTARPRYRRIERGRIRGQDLYAAMGQTQAGRYLIVFFIYKGNSAALVISARDMTSKERKRYGHK